MQTQTMLYENLLYADKICVISYLFGYIKIKINVSCKQPLRRVESNAIITGAYNATLKPWSFVSSVASAADVVFLHVANSAVSSERRVSPGGEEARDVFSHFSESTAAQQIAASDAERHEYPTCSEMQVQIDDCVNLNRLSAKPQREIHFACVERLKQSRRSVTSLAVLSRWIVKLWRVD